MWNAHPQFQATLSHNINFKALKLRWIRVWARFQKVSECYNIPEQQTFQTLRQQKFWVMQRQTFHIKLVFRVNLIWGHDGNLSEVLSSISIIKVIYIPDLLLTHLVDSRTLIEYGFDTFTVESLGLDWATINLIFQYFHGISSRTTGKSNPAKWKIQFISRMKTVQKIFCMPIRIAFRLIEYVHPSKRNKERDVSFISFISFICVNV